MKLVLCNYSICFTSQQPWIIIRSWSSSLLNKFKTNYERYSWLWLSLFFQSIWHHSQTEALSLYNGGKKYFWKPWCLFLPPFLVVILTNCLNYIALFFSCVHLIKKNSSGNTLAVTHSKTFLPESILQLSVDPFLWSYSTLKQGIYYLTCLFCWLWRIFWLEE